MQKAEVHIVSCKNNFFGDSVKEIYTQKRGTGSGVLFMKKIEQTTHT